MLRLTLNALFLAATSSVALAQQPASAALEAVSRLYRDFAWEAEAQQSTRRATSFIEQSKRELERYLEPQLTDLLLADRACVARTKQICRLDFAPLWSSQDPGATNLQVKQGTRQGTVGVSFVYPGNGQRIRLQYEIAETAAGSRIFDIRYESGSSLRSILQRKP
jgi:hypothetical protein